MHILKRAALSEEFGVILEGQGTALPELEVQREWLREYGAVLWRGFAASDTEGFHHHAASLCDSLVRYGGNRTQIALAGLVQGAEPGQQSISLHSEMSYTPFRPDVMLFRCVRPASGAGATTLGAAHHVYELMSPATQRFLTDTVVNTHARYPAGTWRNVLGPTQREAAAALSAYPLSFDFQSDGTLQVHTAKKVVFGDRNGRTCYADSFHKYPSAEPPSAAGGPALWATVGAGEALPQMIRSDIESAIERATLPINWIAGDVLDVDNWRVLHGRQAFSDTIRAIQVCMGRAQWLRPPCIPTVRR
jgi:alpha-ketoglutarate-dependent taurine dioxygenase